MPERKLKLADLQAFLTDQPPYTEAFARVRCYQLLAEAFL